MSRPFGELQVCTLYTTLGGKKAFWQNEVQIPPMFGIHQSCVTLLQLSVFNKSKLNFSGEKNLTWDNKDCNEIKHLN